MQCLPSEVLQEVLSYLDSRHLARMRAVCRRFVGEPGAPAGNNLIEQAARTGMLRLHKGNAGEAERFRGFTWLMRLRIEDTQSPMEVPFDPSTDTERGGMADVTFSQGQLCVKLAAPGPKLLASQQTTHTTDILHWHLELCSDAAVELGVIPADMQAKPGALHQCEANARHEHPIGVHSSITKSSKLPFNVPLMSGSKVELVLHRGVLNILVKQPEEGCLPVMVKGNVVPTPYMGPPQFRQELHYPYQGPAKLAISFYNNTGVRFRDMREQDLRKAEPAAGQCP